MRWGSGGAPPGAQGPGLSLTLEFGSLPSRFPELQTAPGWRAAECPSPVPATPHQAAARLPGHRLPVLNHGRFIGCPVAQGWLRFPSLAQLHVIRDRLLVTPVRPGSCGPIEGRDWVPEAPRWVPQPVAPGPCLICPGKGRCPPSPARGLAVSGHSLSWAETMSPHPGSRGAGRAGPGNTGDPGLRRPPHEAIRSRRQELGRQVPVSPSGPGPVAGCILQAPTSCTAPAGHRPRGLTCECTGARRGQLSRPSCHTRPDGPPPSSDAPRMAASHAVTPAPLPQLHILSGKARIRIFFFCHDDLPGFSCWQPAHVLLARRPSPEPAIGAQPGPRPGSRGLWGPPAPHPPGMDRRAEGRQQDGAPARTRAASRAALATGQGAAGTVPEHLGRWFDACGSGLAACGFPRPLDPARTGGFGDQNVGHDSPPLSPI